MSNSCVHPTIGIGSTKYAFPHRVESPERRFGNRSGPYFIVVFRRATEHQRPLSAELIDHAKHLTPRKLESRLHKARGVRRPFR